jgi:hypothetical protein
VGKLSWQYSLIPCGATYTGRATTAPRGAVALGSLPLPCTLWFATQGVHRARGSSSRIVALVIVIIRVGANNWSIDPNVGTDHTHIIDRLPYDTGQLVVGQRGKSCRRCRGDLIEGVEACWSPVNAGHVSRHCRDNKERQCQYRYQANDSFHG